MTAISQSQTTVVWRPDASHQVTFALVLWLPLVVQRFRVLHLQPRSDPLVLATTLNRSLHDKKKIRAIIWQPPFVFLLVARRSLSYFDYACMSICYIDGHSQMSDIEWVFETYKQPIYMLWFQLYLKTTECNLSLHTCAKGEKRAEGYLDHNWSVICALSLAHSGKENFQIIPDRFRNVSTSKVSHTPPLVSF